MFYFSAPGLSLDAMLKMIKIELKKIIDPDQYMFFEQGIRGRISYINKRYSEASKDVNIFYLDMNDLYGWDKTYQLAILNGLKYKWNLTKINENKK